MQKRTLAAAAGLAAAVSATYVLWANKAPVTDSITVQSRYLPPAFDGLRIAHVSDLHNDSLGRRHSLTMAQLRKAKPDLICITGDLIDARRTDIPCALDFVCQAIQLAPVYYVMGNHESRIPAYPELEQGLRQLGVQVLRNETATLLRDGQSLSIIGLDDPSISPDFPQLVRSLCSAAPGFRLVLCHRPEKFRDYAEAGADLVLTGHAHGGQVRIPGVGGVIAPHQGWLPKYDAGLYTEGRTHMAVSRGLGNSLCPLRVNNRPELLLLVLRSAPIVH